MISNLFKNKLPYIPNNIKNMEKKEDEFNASCQINMAEYDFQWSGGEHG
ncbi:hypothetical protein [Thermococcus sp.]|nr:hypothetical protein [Thermococcus sp.]